MSEVDTAPFAVDLDNCAREPIHLSGAVQPRGVLMVVREGDMRIEKISANCETVLGFGPAGALSSTLEDVLGVDVSQSIARAARAFGDLRERNPHETMVAGVLFDVILHRSQDGLLLVEFELAAGPRPLSFANTYLTVRSAISALNRAASLAELFSATAEAVRDLTLFDRVMVYRYDADFNGEVVAEAKHPDLNTFLGLHYPASDIPAQARALYEKNWLRLISDVDYQPVPILPDGNIDLTYSTLRSVSPIHIEYLKNMGVRASMSISLLQDGRLWGLIACHHYSGPHTPAYGVRAASEFLGSTLSLRLVDRADAQDNEGRVAAQQALSRLVARSVDDRYALNDALLGGPEIFEVVEGDGVCVSLGGAMSSAGVVPSRSAVADIVAAAGQEVFATDCLAQRLPAIEIDPAATSGALVAVLPDGQFVAWFRSETHRSVDWGGDPHNKAIAVMEAGDSDSRLGPRKSFERWSELVRQRSTPWTETERARAGQLRGLLLETLYARARREVQLAESLQRSLLPHDLPEVPGWRLTAHYEPAAGGRIGGDWYDAFELPDARLVVVLGDVAGHGVAAAGAMSQIRNALRAFLHAGAGVPQAVGLLNSFVLDLLPGTLATLLVMAISLDTGTATAVSAGHPSPFHIAGGRASGLAMDVSPPLGVPYGDYAPSDCDIEPGTGLLLFSDGLIERKGEDIDAGLNRIEALFTTPGFGLDADAIVAAANHDGRDDVTVLTVSRSR